ncbi:MmpS family transport accessory protein [[Mycobacterium] wendilense]|uniref:MmpS family transport accessory protein n=2 Tax=[Mycobacterium] wendilense TaxID=3064284 RepID=A0ABN9P2P2_9MYCO|nr:MmpS family transport accessory protein [Mycolicibacterium sp. MU0050]CAJ1585702.1 MmpS family transport accessory protein [Mycolicibacterium sp. MU0050]
MITRFWLPTMIVLALTVGVLTVSQLRTVFGSEPVLVTPVGADTAEKFIPKVVTYEVLGSGTAVVNYLDLDGKPVRAGTVSLPWTLTLETTAPSVAPNIIAQTDGQAITCRITVDDEIKDENTASGVNAQTFCLVKSA